MKSEQLSIVRQALERFYSPVVFVKTEGNKSFWVVNENEVALTIEIAFGVIANVKCEHSLGLYVPSDLLFYIEKQLWRLEHGKR